MTTKPLTESVREFRNALGLPVGDHPRLLTAEQTSFYARFLMEELSEFLEAHEHQDLVKAFDAILDLVYVAVGVSVHMGLPFDEGFDVVHSCNMKKRPGSTKRNGLGQDAMKPEMWKGPEGDLGLLIYRSLYNERDDET